MIATILPGSSNFHAVGYNERKVAKGVARMLEMQNFGTLGTFGKPTRRNWSHTFRSTLPETPESKRHSSTSPFPARDMK